MKTKDPMALDLLASMKDKTRVYFDYGRTEAVALKRGGMFNVKCRLRELARIMDVLTQCRDLDRDPPPWNRPPIIRLPYVTRAK